MKRCLRNVSGEKERRKEGGEEGGSSWEAAVVRGTEAVWGIVLTIPHNIPVLILRLRLRGLGLPADFIPGIIRQRQTRPPTATRKNCQEFNKKEEKEKLYMTRYVSLLCLAINLRRMVEKKEGNRNGEMFFWCTAGSTVTKWGGFSTHALYNKLIHKQAMWKKYTAEVSCTLSIPLSRFLTPWETPVTAQQRKPRTSVYI